MKPGARTRPLASISCTAVSVRRDSTAEIRPSRTATSRDRGAPPLPSITVARVGDLRRGAPEEYCGKVRDPADVAQRLQDQADRFSATCRAAVDADIGRAPQKIGLPSGLRRDRYGGRW